MGYNVFLAEDDEDDRHNFILALQDINMHVALFTAENGEEIVEMLLQFSAVPHVIILDINMPKKNGIDSLQEIRTSKRFESIPIVIFSTSVDTRSINDARKFGANHYIQKPCNFNKLREIVKFCISLPAANKTERDRTPFLIAEPYSGIF